jgi:hypothetical protein
MSDHRPTPDEEALARLSDALAEDVLGTTDKEMLAEAVQRGADPAAEAEAGRALFDRISAEVAKVKMAEAKAAVAATRRPPRAGPRLSADEARQAFDRMVAANDAELSRKLTMAARKGEGQSDRDIAGVMEDLADLGAFDDGSEPEER